MKRQHLFDDPKRIRRLFLAFYVLLGAVLLPDLFIHKHAAFAWEEYPLFYAAFGFAAFVVLILAAKHLLRPLVKRREDYYE